MRHGKLVVSGLIVGCAAAGCRPAPLSPVAPAPAVRPGLEVVVTDSAHLLRGRRVGLVSNQAGVDRQGRSGVDVLLHAGVRLTALFSPEHGFRGLAAPGEAVASTVDSATGLPIYSLYGRTTAPTPEMLDQVDVMLIDLQDVGARYYTWLATTVEVMRAAAERGKPVILLDRPNPIGGAVQGNVLDPAYTSSVGRLAVPMRHGLTLGELALLARSELGLATDVRVVPVAGWRRTMAFDRTGLPFIPPSPNLRDLEALYHYPGLCVFEATALSVGRGTDAPFRQIGAPWLDTAAVLARLAGTGLPGVRFEAVTFTPRRPGDGKYADTLVVGIRAVLTDPSRYDPTHAAVRLLHVLRQVHPDRLAIDPRRFDRLAGGPALREALEAGEPPERIVASWREPVRRFLARRRAVLLYQ
jgi:uncharacterized protein YbbC (DUF1343 family)